MLRPTLLLLTAAVLLPAVSATAQTPPAAKAAAQSVSLQIAIVPANVYDLDALGLERCLMSPHGSPDAPFAYAAGSIVSHVGMTLTREDGHAFFPDAVIGFDGISVTIPVDIEGSDWTNLKTLSNETIIPKTFLKNLAVFILREKCISPRIS